MTLSTGCLSAYDLQTEYRDTPLGLGTRNPRFSWRLASPLRGDYQAAYRIRVLDINPLSPGSAPAWDSGWVASGSTTNAPYAGAPLLSSTRYRWELQIRDRNDVETERYASWFETALLEREDFRARWVRRNPFQNSPVVPPHEEETGVASYSIPSATYLRGTSTVSKPIVRARAYVTAHGLYKLHINGHLIGDHELAPGWTDYNDRVMYQTFDITNVLHFGKNAIGMILADGWWSGYVGFDRRHQAHHYGTAPEAWLQVLIEYEDGSKSIAGTDKSWVESEGAIRSTDLLMGEVVDFHLDADDWTLPSFDDSHWVPVIVSDTGHDTLHAMVDEPIRAMETVTAQKVTASQNGWIVDFGQNLVGRVRLTLSDTSESRTIRFRHAEVLNEDGTLYTDNLRSAAATDVFMTADGTHTLEPMFTVHGFRYAEISGLNERPALESVCAIVLRNDIPWAGSFTCSNPDINQLESNIRWGQRGNFVAVPTDCPQRDERLGWMADAQVFLPTAAYNADVASFFTRWLKDVRYTQSIEGSFPDIAPRTEPMRRDGAPAWGDAGVIIPWYVYRTYGDTQLLAESFVSMCAWIDFIERQNRDLIWEHRVGNNYGDWLQLDAETPRDVLSTAYFANSTDLVARAARVLGDDNACRKYSQLASRIRNAFRAHFADSEYRIAGDTQTCYLLALQFDLFPESARTALTNHLVRTVERSDTHLTTGFVGVAFLCPVLCDVGRPDLAYKLLLNEDYPSWLYSIRHGATTIWERWDGYTDTSGFQSAEMNSFNHYSLGSIGEWLYRYVAGIDQADDSVAFERLNIAPTIGGGLEYAEAQYVSSRGIVKSSWTLKSDGIHFVLSIPPGSVARVTLPAENTSRINEGGLPILENRHISDVTSEKNSVSFSIGSGSYELHCT